jgi:putative DNA primase/helicase
MARVPIDCMFFVTGNNLAVGTDTARRSIRVRLESNHENPEERTDFAHPRLTQWVQAERQRLLAAAITMLRAYICAGKPSQDLTPLGSFDGWSDLVRAAITWVGEPDPALARVTAEDAMDPKADAHLSLLLSWHLLSDPTGNGLTTAQILGQISHDRDTFEDMVEALTVLCPTTDGRLPDPHALGCILRQYRGRARIHSGKRYKVTAIKNAQKTRTWGITTCDLGENITETGKRW